MASPERLLLVVLLLAVSCKPPRSPREIARERVTGEWHAQSVAAGAPQGSGALGWSMALHELTLELRMRSGTAHFQGAIHDARTIAGEWQRRSDTVAVTFSRRTRPR